jgi:DNA-binding transcriptional regulator YdaS (Cro superfamily)
MTLRDWLCQRDMSQSAFADRVGCTPNTVRRWVSGGKPRPPTVRRIRRMTHGEVRPADWVRPPL